MIYEEVVEIKYSLILASGIVHVRVLSPRERWVDESAMATRHVMVSLACVDREGFAMFQDLR
jgi:hypothetical protein